MRQMQIMLDVADNTGAKQIMCIKVLGGTRRRYAYIGDIVVGAVKKTLPGVDIKQGEIVRGVIVRTRKSLRRDDGLSKYQASLTRSFQICKYYVEVDHRKQELLKLVVTTMDLYAASRLGVRRRARAPV